jgi:hypothetical protein
MTSWTPYVSLLVCDVNLLHIRRENSQELKVSDFGAIGDFIPIDHSRRFCLVLHKIRDMSLSDCDTSHSREYPGEYTSNQELLK